MKRKIRVIIVVLLSLVIGFLGYTITSKLNHKKEVAERTKVIPSFSFYTLEGNEFSEKNILRKPTLFIYFNSECDYCQSEATKIHERLSDFEGMQLLFVSFEEKMAIQQFAKEYQLINKENILFLEDRKGAFSELFDVNSIPYMVIYDENKKLLKKFKGATKVDKILEVLKTK